MALPRRLIDPKTIYLEPEVRNFARGREALERFPDARLIEVASHARIPELFADEALAADWLRMKRDVLVLGVKKGLALRPNGRSADFIAPSTSNGCAMACSYCYVPRRKGYANPVTIFVNVEAISAAIARHAAKLGPKPLPNSVDPVDWVYDLGENGDLSADATITGTVRDLVAAFRDIPNAKGSFATKLVNRELLDYDPRGRTRIRFSLMPEGPSKVVDVRTSPIEERIAAINDFVEAGYEVHVNFSPVIVHEGWEPEWRGLFAAIDDTLSDRAKAQLKCEIIMLTHNAGLHEINLAWHPKGEDLLWRPDLQETKISQNGMANLRYRTPWNKTWLERLLRWRSEMIPYCEVRYAF
ncbi:spore photoproduct lyase family protein [Chenggangzhangella methanolivorans]|uniref:Spore photoproduct lyase family protein n=1 Tax=Chenggangzhangella methanolivorans TaxID=1437009 RepID=A0A9E6R938_9HYPH|nr:spore photoproduct lyase family protein [Chenggangzhangella methanolivorans]QZN98887.1 spore photoproduct lyase family protein [Chenggangzhangella methanolivorans]